jgi:hypothetical protein
MATSLPPAVEWVALSRLFCNPANPRHNDEAVPHVAASLRRFGWRQPVVAKRTGEVIAGNTRLKAARSLGMTEVPVWWFEGTDLEATAYGVADNKTAEFAEWDNEALGAILQQLRAEDALDGVGFPPASSHGCSESLNPASTISSVASASTLRRPSSPAAANGATDTSGRPLNSSAG